jgi:hypothetical protein
MRKIAVTLAVAFLLPAAGCKKPEFQEFSPPDGRFKVLLPGSPRKEERNDQGIQFTMYLTRHFGEEYGVGYADVPPGRPVDLNGAVTGMAQKVAGSNTSSTGGTEFVNGAMSGWREFEITATKPQGFASGRVVHARGRLFIVLAIGKEHKLSHPDVRKFVDSFRLTDGPTPGVDGEAGANPVAVQPPLPITPDMPKPPVVIPPPVFPKPPVVNPTPKLDPKPTPKVDPGPSTPKKPQALGGTFDTEFTEAAPAGGVLIGFDVGISTFVNRDIIGTLRPVFRVGRQEILGEIHGTDSKRTVNVVAKDGYAVGAITVKTGLGIDGFSLTFMKIAGDKLDPNDSYKSDWIGGMGGGRQVTQDGGGKPVVGIIGKVTKKTAKNATGIGLIFKE